MLVFILMAALIFVVVYSYRNIKKLENEISLKNIEIATLNDNDERLIKRIATLEYELSIKNSATQSVKVAKKTVSKKIS